MAAVGVVFNHDEALALKDGEDVDVNNDGDSSANGERSDGQKYNDCKKMLCCQQELAETGIGKEK